MLNLIEHATSCVILLFSFVSCVGESSLAVGTYCFLGAFDFHRKFV